jgi:hypothetical protein
MPMMDGNGILLPPVNGYRDIRKLTYNLGSDTYGAHYFVKLCFWASEVPHPVDLVSDFKIEASFTQIAHMDANNDYAIDAKLGWKQEIECSDGSQINNTDGGNYGSNGAAIKLEHWDELPIKMCSVTYSFWEENNDMQRPHALRSDKFQLWAGVEQNFKWQDVTW